MNSQNTKTFHPFPRLPFELRTLIWKHHLPSSRRIRMHVPYYPKLRPKSPPPRAPPSRPIILSIDRQSRDIGLSHYQKIEHNTIYSCSFINWNTDIFVIELSEVRRRIDYYLNIHYDNHLRHDRNEVERQDIHTHMMTDLFLLPENEKRAIKHVVLVVKLASSWPCVETEGSFVMWVNNIMPSCFLGLESFRVELVKFEHWSTRNENSEGMFRGFVGHCLENRMGRERKETFLRVWKEGGDGE